MKLCVYGAGAVGGALAVRLKAAGEDVSIVARGAHAAAIRADGLALVAEDTRTTVHLPCVDDPRALAASPDVVFVTVKQTHLAAMAERLAELQAAGARLVFAMNGIPWWFADELPIPDKDAFVDGLDPGRALRSRLDARGLVGAVVQSSNEVIAPGVVLATTPTRNRLIMGNVASGADNRIGEIVDVVTRAGYDGRETPEIRRELWNKMTLWLAVSPIAAITGLALDRLVGDRGGYALMIAILREAAVVGRRLGFAVVDDAEERIGFYRDKPTRPSLLKDFELGREPELASGVLVFDALARALAMPSPNIAAIAALCRLRYAGMWPQAPAIPA